MKRVTGFSTATNERLAAIAPLAPSWSANTAAVHPVRVMQSHLRRDARVFEDLANMVDLVDMSAVDITDATPANIRSWLMHDQPLTPLLLPRYRMDLASTARYLTAQRHITAQSLETQQAGRASYLYVEDTCTGRNVFCFMEGEIRSLLADLSIGVPHAVLVMETYDTDTNGVERQRARAVGALIVIRRAVDWCSAYTVCEAGLSNGVPTTLTFRCVGGSGTRDQHLSEVRWVMYIRSESRPTPEGVLGSCALIPVHLEQPTPEDDNAVGSSLTDGPPTEGTADFAAPIRDAVRDAVRVRSSALRDSVTRWGMAATSPVRRSDSSDALRYAIDAIEGRGVYRVDIGSGDSVFQTMALRTHNEAMYRADIIPTWVIAADGSVRPAPIMPTGAGDATQKKDVKAARRVPSRATKRKPVRRDLDVLLLIMTTDILPDDY